MFRQIGVAVASAEQDSYGRISYSRLIAWPERIQREAPLLQRVLARAPSREVLDLGCGSGEHARYLGSLGFAVTGVDASLSQLEAARAADPGGLYLQAGLVELDSCIGEGQGGAICIGNTLPHLCEEADLHAFFAGLAACLLPGSPLLLQLLNYDRILDRDERAFPLLLRPGEGEGESLVFLRLMTHLGGGRLAFTPATLRYRPGSGTPLELVAASEVALRGWRRAEVETALGEAGFQTCEVLGTMTGEPWSSTSPDLVIVATRNQPS
jgi:glycine/sarcosine N-methyltransferase